jgi:hypothetical protein
VVMPKLGTSDGTRCQNAAKLVQLGKEDHLR